MRGLRLLAVVLAAFSSAGSAEVSAPTTVQSENAKWLQENVARLSGSVREPLCQLKTGQPQDDYHDQELIDYPLESI
jgi:hypothetical protein